MLTGRKKMTPINNIDFQTRMSLQPEGIAIEEGKLLLVLLEEQPTM
jgi:hypothetical protein